MNEKIYVNLDRLIERYPVLSPCRQSIADAYELLRECYCHGGKLHLPVYHCLCLMLEETFFGESQSCGEHVL